MPVRDVDAAASGHRLNIGASGAALTNYTLMWVGRLKSIAAPEPMFGIITGAATTIGVMYYDPTNQFALGTPSGDITAPITLDATSYWLLAIAVTASGGSDSAVFYAKNLTTGAAVVTNSPGATAPVVAGSWGHTEISGSDGYTFNGNRRHGAAFVFDYAISSGNFNTIAAAASTASVKALTTPPIRGWEFNQASTATAVPNTMTGTADQNSITGTAVITADDPIPWTFDTGSTPVNITATLAGAGSLIAVPHAGVTEVAVGAVATATSGDVTANYPAGVGEVLTGDVILCDVTARDNVVVTFPAGWTKKAEANNGTGLRKTLAWKRRAGGDSDTSVVVTHTAGAQIIARVHVVRGAIASGDPFGAFTGPTSIAAAGTGVFPNITTVNPGALLFYSLAYQDDYATAPAITNAQGLTLTERDSTEVA